MEERPLSSLETAASPFALTCPFLKKYASAPEHIVFCLDSTPEMSQGWTTSSPFQTRLDIVKHVVSVFLSVKTRLNPRHKFALVSVNGRGSQVLLPFTSSLQEFTRKLETLSSTTAATSTVDSDTQDDALHLAHLLGETLPSFSSSSEKKKEEWEELDATTFSCPPPLLRAILLMGASYTFPLLPEPALVEDLFSHDNFFLDLLYVHARQPFLPPPGPSLSSSPAITTLKKSKATPMREEDDDVTVLDSTHGDPAVLPPPLPRRRLSSDIWKACLELLADRHPMLPETGYFFTVPCVPSRSFCNLVPRSRDGVMRISILTPPSLPLILFLYEPPLRPHRHGCGPNKIMRPLQLLLAHPIQRLPQTAVEERLCVMGGAGERRSWRRRYREGRGEEREGALFPRVRDQMRDKRIDEGGKGAIEEEKQH